MKTCIVCNISGPNASKYLDVYSTSLKNNTFVVYLTDDVNLVYTNGTPRSQPDYVEEREKSEGFSFLSKFYSIKDCIDEMNPDYVIWLDASCRIHNGFIEKAKSIMDEHGVFILKESDTGGQWWCTDKFMECIQEDRENYNQPTIISGVFGFNLIHEHGKQFYDMLEKTTQTPDMWFGNRGIPWVWDVQGTDKLSLDPRVKGHRHDQSVIGYIVQKLNLYAHNNIEQPIFYSQNYIQEQWLKDPSKDAYYFPSDALVTHHPPETHFIK